MGESFRPRCTVFLVSDGVGTTAQAVLDAAMAQFPHVEFEMRRFPGVRSVEQIREIVEEAERSNGIIVHTVVIVEIRRLLVRECHARLIDHVDLLGPLLGQISQKVGVEPLLRPGAARGVGPEYFQRIEAIQYTVRHDDGQGLETLGEADIVLVGVSRTSKTPLSVYLSMSGWKVANVPIILNVPPPPQLRQIDQRKIVGLTIDKDELLRIRQHRLQALGGTLPGEYADPEKVAEELIYFRRVARIGYPWPLVNITGKSIEEIAKEVVSIIQRQRLRGLVAPGDSEAEDGDR
ncbi:kinase/pyrophosphorylase [Thermomicrobium sp. CFH 73360]|uniref:pyruvate, water dikinase regulatory protein n=1 Tax=Thermomicrobium sp. CFH 73360 TaxID=2951987 RepID=UPI002076B6CF|nr:pyruvate, water dikinase regulatory protein [Thermomicrobium sp. CFH 73360]MCM8745147.1 kinase/pyrophosphorylase [Thermomicrobium sp. CFH 73360]